MAESDFDKEKIMQFFKGKYSDEDFSYINKIFCDQYNEKELKQILLEQWDELSSKDFEANRDLDHILYRIHYQINTNASKKGRSLKNALMWSVRISAVIFLPIIFYIVFNNYHTTHPEEDMSFVEINAPAWTRTQFRLPDGSTGWLNSNSSLKYEGNFKSDRQVHLSGEGFFDIIADAENPFIVNTNDTYLTVFGTRFNITSYENEDYIEVVLDEGKLVFNYDDMNISYKMAPNEKVVYNKTLNDFSLEIVNPMKYTSWTEGMLAFRNDPLDVIARRLERWYNVDVVIEENVSSDIKLRATFFDESLEEVLYLLKRSLKINYRIIDRDLGSGDSYSRKRVIITEPA